MPPSHASTRREREREGGSGMQAEPPVLSAMGRTERVTRKERMELPGTEGVRVGTMNRGGRQEQGRS